MLFKALDEARKTRSSLKKEIFAKILKGAILGFENREFSSEEYLYIISDLTEQEIVVALALYTEQPPLNFKTWQEEDEAWAAWAEKVSDLVKVDIADLRFAMGRLASAGLIDRVYSYEDEVDLHVYPWSESAVGIYQVAPGFKKLVRLIERES
jgi:hypothetical protein